MGKIYKITNKITGKVYIGKTIRETLQERFNQHISSSRKIENASLISKSLREYGTLNHSIEVLEECDDSIILQREQHWIDEYNSIFLGYNLKNEFIIPSERKYWGDFYKAKENLAKGFVWNKGISPKISTREKIAETRRKKSKLGFYKDSYGHKHTEETKKRLSDIAKNRPPLTEETKQKLSDKSKNRNFYYSITDKKRILIKSDSKVPEGYVKGKGLCCVHKNGVNVYIGIWEKEKYIQDGFKEGELKNVGKNSKN